MSCQDYPAMDRRYPPPLFGAGLLGGVSPDVLVRWAADCAGELIQFVGPEADEICTECVEAARAWADSPDQAAEDRGEDAEEAGACALEEAYRVALGSQEAEPERAVLAILTALVAARLVDARHDIAYVIEQATKTARATSLTDEWVAGRLAFQMGYPMGRAQVQVAMGLLPSWELSLNELFAAAIVVDCSSDHTDPIPVLKEFIPMLIRQAERNRELEEMLIGDHAEWPDLWEDATSGTA